jgi:integrase
MLDNWLYLMLKRLSERAGIPGLHSHQFRHTFSINMIEAEVPLPTLEVMGGWSKIPQTYLATLGDRAARAAHRRVSPADRLRVDLLLSVMSSGSSRSSGSSEASVRLGGADPVV